MIRAGLRRLVTIVAVVIGATAAISAALGAAAGKSILHSLALGYYLVGAGVLLGSLALGSRGPMRAERGDEDRPIAIGGLFPLFGGRTMGRRKLRKTTPEERKQARLSSIGLFVFGVLLVFLGAVIDPTRRAF